MIEQASHYYRRQTKFAKVIFLHVSLSTGGGAGQVHPPSRYTPWDQVHPHPLE